MAQYYEFIFAAALATAVVMKSVLPSVYIGLFLANICAISNLAEKWQKFTPFIMKITGLSAASAVSTILSISDRTAGMAALAMARKQVGLRDEEIIAANLVAKAPSVIQFFVFSFIPIMVSMYPQVIVVHFLTVYFLAFMMISLVGVLQARLLLPKRLLPRERTRHSAAFHVSWHVALKQAVSQTWRPFITMSYWMAGMSFVAMLLIKAGVLNGLVDYLPFAASGFDTNVIPVVGAGLVSMLGGVAAVGVAFNEGTIPANAIVPLLLSVSLLHNCYDMVASSMPRTVAIFGKRLGLKVGLWSFGVTQVVMVTMTVLVIKGWL